MKAEARECVWQCLHYMDSKAGEPKPCPLGEMVHGARVGEVIYFDFPYIGAGGAMGKEGVGKVAFKYLFLTVEVVSGYVRIVLAVACRATATAKVLLRLCAALDVSQVWVKSTLRRISRTGR